MDRTRIDGLAYVLPYGKSWKWLKFDMRDNPAELARQRAIAPQHVIETDPSLFDIDERAAFQAGPVNPMGPPQAWQAEWRRAHYVTPSMED